MDTGFHVKAYTIMAKDTVQLNIVPSFVGLVLYEYDMDKLLMALTGIAEDMLVSLHIKAAYKFHVGLALRINFEAPVTTAFLEAVKVCNSPRFQAAIRQRVLDAIAEVRQVA
jgi:hypothetical protein